MEFIHKKEQRVCMCAFVCMYEYYILIESGVHMAHARLIKSVYNETYSKVPIVKYVSDAFPTQNCLKQRDVSLQLHSTLLYSMPL
jgi:hypothetical protein